MLIDQLAQAGILVEVRHVDNSTHRLGYNWRDVFLPVSREDRGYPNRKQPEAQPADGDIGERLRSIQAAIAGLSNAIGELRLSQHAIQQHIAAERQLAKDRAASIRADMQTLINNTARNSGTMAVSYALLPVRHVGGAYLRAVPRYHSASETHRRTGQAAGRR